MGRDLANRYSQVFDTHRLMQPLSFARDIYATGKWRELSSFVVWELRHRLHLFRSRQYLKFTDYEPLALNPEDHTDCSDFDNKIGRGFAGLGLHATACEHQWKVVYSRPDGRILASRYPDDSVLYESGDGHGINFVQRFPSPIKAIFVSRSQTVFVCVKGALYRREPSAGSFDKVLNLAAPDSFFRHNNGMTETPDGTLLIGEYGNVWDHRGWNNLAFLYWSSDDGSTWTASDFFIRHGTNKHIHLVRYSRVWDKLLVADGDNYKKLWTSDRIADNDWRQLKWSPANRFHIQMGGYTSMAESDGKVFFGTDYQGGTNFIVESANGKAFTRKVVPDPYRRSPVDNMVLRKSQSKTEIWANLPFSTAGSKCLLMFSDDGGSRWNKLLEYSRRTHIVWLASSSADAPKELYVSVRNTQNNRRAVYKVGDMQC